MVDVQVFLGMKSIQKALLWKVILEAISVLQLSFIVGRKTSPGVGKLVFKPPAFN